MGIQSEGWAFVDIHFGAVPGRQSLSEEDMARFDVVVQCLGEQVEGR